MYNDHHNEHCEIAAKLLETESGLLDYRLVAHLNKINNTMGGGLTSKGLISLAIVQWQTIVQWQENKADDFTKQKT